MKKILVLLAGPAYLLLLAGFTCTHYSYGTEEGKAFFWKKNGAQETHYLYVDNSVKGVLPFIPDSKTVPGNTIVQDQGLFLKLKPGKYDIAAKDKSGNILCEGTLLLKRTDESREISASWNNTNCNVEMVYAK